MWRRVGVQILPESRSTTRPDSQVSTVVPSFAGFEDSSGLHPEAPVVDPLVGLFGSWPAGVVHLQLGHDGRTVEEVPEARGVSEEVAERQWATRGDDRAVLQGDSDLLEFGQHLLEGLVEATSPFDELQGRGARDGLGHRCDVEHGVGTHGSIRIVIEETVRFELRVAVVHDRHRRGRKVDVANSSCIRRLRASAESVRAESGWSGGHPRSRRKSAARAGRRRETGGSMRNRHGGDSRAGRSKGEGVSMLANAFRIGSPESSGRIDHASTRGDVRRDIDRFVNSWPRWSRRRFWRGGRDSGCHGPVGMAAGRALTSGSGSSPSDAKHPAIHSI